MCGSTGSDVVLANTPAAAASAVASSEDVQKNLKSQRYIHSP